MPHEVIEIYYYPDWDAWFTSTRYQCIVGYTMIYARSVKHLTKQLKRLGVEMPTLTEPQWTGISNQHLVYSDKNETPNPLAVLKERYDG